MRISYILVLAIVLLSGCTPVDEAPEVQVAEEILEEIDQVDQKPLAEGQRRKFSLVYETAPQYDDLREALQEATVFDKTVEGINEVFDLPVDVTVLLQECGESNAFYDPNTYQIAICYELMDYLAELFANEGLYTDDEVVQLTIDATFFIFYHELGHALVDVLQLPTTGREEDVADQLATVLSVDGDYGDTALSGGYAFALIAEQTVFDTPAFDLPFWDEHSLEGQRFYNIYCWLYGSDPIEFRSIVLDELLPEDRAVQCEGEYGQMAKSWEFLLAPHVRE